MNESTLNRMIREHKARIIWFLVFLILAVFVTALVFGTLKRSVQAQTYTKRVFVCASAQEGAEPVAHQHNDDCYENGELICTLPERELHIHGDECYEEEKVLVCTLEESEGHVHTDACYTEEPVLVCGLEENNGHVHSVENGCYTRVQGDLICTDEDPEHVHTDDCYAWEEVLTCEIPEGEGAHHHSEECYETQRVLSCGKEEGEGAHTHDDTCYEIQKVLICDKEEVKTEHVHTVDCFKVVDMSPEEIHALRLSELPESDPNADVESPDVWESRFSSVPLSGHWDRDLLKIAETQLGYTESQRNFDAVLNEDGDGYTLKGWTRYGAWYGIPYGDWCAMFISFCLNYADIPESAIPYDCATTTWIDSLSARGMYAPAGSYDPKPGDLIFFDWEGDGLADQVGIVWSVDPDAGIVKTIEGNHTSSVEYFDYYLTDGHICGYGILPVNPNAPVEETQNEEEEKVEMPAVSFEETIGGMIVSVEADEGAFPAGTTMQVKEVVNEELEEQVTSTASGEIVHVQAIDISFWDADKNEIEPLIPIRVTMQPAPGNSVEADYVEVVHVDDNGGISTVNTDSSSEVPEAVAVFDTDAFSTFYIIHMIDTYYRSFTGETFKITLNYDETTGIPAGATLKVQEILQDSPEYKEYYDQAMATVRSDENPEEVPEDRYARFFDIEIWKDDEKIEPQGPVSVSITLQDVPEDVDEQWNVVHFSENGPEVVAAENEMEVNDGTAEMKFVSESFSVYGVITFPSAPQGVTDLGGRKFTISRNNNSYLTKNVLDGGSNGTNQFEKVNNADSATVWEFESAGEAGKYYIFTTDQDGTRQYMRLFRRDGDRAHAELGEPQAFTILMDNGKYVFQTVSIKGNSQTTYYLNEFNGGRGYAGWSARSSNYDRLDLNFVSPTNMQANEEYMVLVRHEGQYYIVRNDGSLVPVTYQDGTVYVDDPMLWKYTGSNLYHHASAVGYEGWSRLASDSFYRYIDPTSDPDSANGWSEEDDSDFGYGDIRTESDGSRTIVGQRHMMADSAFTYVNNKIRSNKNQNYYIGVKEIDGKLYLKGQASENEAAEIFFAEATKVAEPLWEKHAVNHIDISIKGTASIDVPLAYGDYYNRGGSPILSVSKSDPRKVTLTENQVDDKSQLQITYEDMKRSSISAYTKDANGEPHNLDDAFYVTGYTANETTSISTVQVRIEGSFKVANLDYTVNPYWYSSDFPFNEYTQNVNRDRLNNRVYYTVTVIKPVTFNIVHPDTGEQLYDAEGNPLKITADVAFSASFDYWDSRNECPPVKLPQYGANGRWEQGFIATDNLSGMDFRLGGQTEVNPDVYAVEVTKIVMDESGNRIKSNNAGKNIVLIYKNTDPNADPNSVKDLAIGAPESEPIDYSDYLLQHTKQISVGTDGMGIVYDYDVTPGLYYVKEDPSSIPATITDLSGNNWSYKETYFETEYAWRNCANDDKMHVGVTSPTDRNDAYSSVPEVLGDHPGYDDGITYENQFLEFYVYNVYQPAKVDVPVEKTWTALEGDEYSWSSTFRLQWAPLYEGQTAPTVAFRDVDPVQEITMTKDQMADLSASAQERTFKDLPKYGHDVSGATYRIIYSLEEISYKIWTEDSNEDNPTLWWTKGAGYSSPDEETHYEPFYLHDAGELSEENSDYNIRVANALRRTEKEYMGFHISKRWDSSFTDLQDDWSATFELRRYSHTEYRDLSRVKDEDIVKNKKIILTLKADGQQIDQISVYPNTGIYLAATFAPHTERKSATFSYGTGSVTINAVGSNQGKETVRSNEIFLNEDTEITLTAGAENLVGGAQGARILDTRAGTYPVADTSFNGESFTLNNGTPSKDFSGLISRETSLGANDGNENVTVYEYYFVETASSPESTVSFYAADASGNPTTAFLGDQANRIDTDNQHVVAVNKPKSNLEVKKVWRGVPDTTGYPEITFTLYQGWVNGEGVVSINSGDSWMYENGKYKNIKLNKQNNWTWSCPENLPTLMEDPKNPGTIKHVGYYVQEDQQTGGSGNSTWSFHYYSNSNGKMTNSYNQGGSAGLPGNEGTLYIYNRMNIYRQMDIKKQYFVIHSDGAWDNITATDDMCRDAVLGFKVLRRIVFPDGHKSAWMDYGDEMLCGYAPDGTPVMDNGTNGFFLECADGESSSGHNWHFRIREQGGDLNSERIGLPGYGYYVDENGTSIPVGYEYSYRETGVYKDLNRTPYPEWGWWSTGTPDRYTDSDGNVIRGKGPTPKAFPDQDEDRIANFQASDLEIVKEWLGATDVQEIYVKIYRYTTDADNAEDFTEIIANAEDFTEKIATDISTHHNWSRYVVDPAVIDTTHNWLILAPSSSDQVTASVKISGLLPKTVDKENGDTYYYYIQEVGYKDKEGNVHNEATGTGSFLVYDPHYDKWISGDWEGTTKVNPVTKAITIGGLGENKLKVINTPTMDLTVEKKWVDENGDDIEPWDDIEQVSFRVRMKYTQYNDNGVQIGEPQSIPLTFTIDGQTTELLTVKSQGQKVSVLHDPANDSTAHNQYSALVTDDSDVGNWKTAIDGLQSRYVCDNGEEYYCTYYIVEEAPEGGRTTVTGDGVSEGGHTVTVTNTKIGTGALKITKNVTINGRPITVADGLTSSPIDGVYQFKVSKIEKVEEIDTEVEVGTVEIEYSGGRVIRPEAGYVLVDNLSPGMYVVREITPTNGTSLVLAERGDGYESAVNLTNNEVRVVVTEKDHTAAHKDSQAVFTNNLPKTDIRIQKVDQDGVSIGGAVFSLYRKDTADGTRNIVEAIEGVELDEDHFFTITQDGIELKGLGPGFYELQEESAPRGYLITKKVPVTFTIKPNGDVENTSDSTIPYQNNTFTVKNIAGQELPQSGGSGTALFALIGGLLVGTAGAALILFRKMNRG